MTKLTNESIPGCMTKKQDISFDTNIYMCYLLDSFSLVDVLYKPPSVGAVVVYLSIAAWSSFLVLVYWTSYLIPAGENSLHISYTEKQVLHQSRLNTRKCESTMISPS